jgi:hypothetical protein
MVRSSDSEYVSDSSSRWTKTQSLFLSGAHAGGGYHQWDVPKQNLVSFFKVKKEKGVSIDS